MQQASLSWTHHFAGRGTVFPALLLACALTGCKSLDYVSTRPLDDAGFSYSAVQQLLALDINNAEVAELAKAKTGDVSEQACIELVRTVHGRKQRFASGGVVADLHAAGVSDDAIVELARLDQLGLWAGEAQAIRLSGISDRTMLAVARRHAEGKPTLSGNALGKLKNAGIGEGTIYELVVRGAVDAHVDSLVAARRKRGWTDADLLLGYPPQ
jgi:hypothetical protein